MSRQKNHGFSNAEASQENWPSALKFPSPAERYSSVPESADNELMELRHRLISIESKLDQLIENRDSEIQQEWYTPAEFASLLNKKRYTVSEWCRLERINATKAESGRGRAREWRISHSELERYQREGLLPLKYPGM